MKWVVLILLAGLISCTTTNQTASRPAPAPLAVAPELWDRQKLTDSVRFLLSRLTMLDTAQWTLSNGQVKMKQTDSLTVSYLMVKGPAPVIDTTHQHVPIDTIPVVPKIKL